MKRGLKLLLMSLAFIPFGVNAATVDVGLSCPDSAKASEIVSCTLKATPNGTNLKGLEAKYEITGGTYSSFTLASGWTEYQSNSIGFSLGRSEATTKGVTVGTLKVKMPTTGNAVVKLVNVEGANQAYDTLTSDGASKTIRVKSNVNTLDSLSVSGATFTFNKNTTTYDVTVDSATTTISATKTDKYSSVSGTGKKNLNYGKNTFNIVVTSETGVKKTYTININRPDNRSTNNYLSSIKLSDGKINFNKTTYTYNVEVAGKVTKMTIESTLDDIKASFVKGYGNRTVNLEYGTNTIKIKVLSEKQTERTYTLNITRKDDRSTNNYLSSIKLSDGKINFNKTTTSYNVEVASNITKVNIESTLDDSKASYVNGFSGNRTVNLNYGNNTIKIKIASEKGTERLYTININRKDDRSSNTNLKNITLSSGILSFNKSLTEYQVSVENEVEEIKITATPEDIKSKVEVVESKKLEIGNNEIIIKVTAENGKTKEYKIVIIRKEKNQVLDDNNYLKELIISGYEIDFVKDKTSYDITIKDEKELNIKYKTESNKAMATIIGNEDLKDSSIIKITVYSESGLAREYNINIHAEKQELIPLPIAISIFAIGVLSFGISICYFKSKK